MPVMSPIQASTPPVQCLTVTLPLATGVEHVALVRGAVVAVTGWVPAPLAVPTRQAPKTVRNASTNEARRSLTVPTPQSLCREAIQTGSQAPCQRRCGPADRGDWIRTSDRSAPSRVRYQTALRPVEDENSSSAGSTLLMIDVHCHLLPSLDDGPRDISDTVAMARQAADDGIEVIVATPHIRDDHDVVIAELDACGGGKRSPPSGRRSRADRTGRRDRGRADQIAHRRRAAAGLDGRRWSWLLVEPRPGPIDDHLVELVDRLHFVTTVMRPDESE